MKPVEFKGSNTIIGANQPEYTPLPALVLPDGEVITCWDLSDDEIQEIIKTRKMYISQLTFGNSLQPILPRINLEDVYGLADEDGNEINGEEVIGMKCEHNGCNNTHGKDYKRKIVEKGWEDEPIFLCDKHSKGFEKYD